MKKCKMKHSWARTIHTFQVNQAYVKNFYSDVSSGNRFHRIKHRCRNIWSRHGRDHMIVGFTTTCAIIAYHH
jgi:hypothetical protein